MKRKWFYIQKKNVRIVRNINYLPKNVLETSSVEAIKKYVINGLGVSYLPYYAIKAEADEGLISHKFSNSDLHFFTQIAYHSNK